MMSTFGTLNDIEVHGKRVIVRVDLNVPIEGNKVSDLSRIKAITPTLIELLEKEAKVIVLSHFGRPKGKRIPAMSLSGLTQHLSAALDGHRVAFSNDCIGDDTFELIKGLQNGQIILLENVRFHPGEETNDPNFSAALAKLGDLFVNDAFSAAHRAHASTTGITRYLPAIAGRLMEQELNALNKVLLNPKHPVMAVVGGAKVSTKISLLANLVTRVDILAIGGSMANTFLAAQGYNMGASRFELDLLDVAKDVCKKADISGCKLLLPTDGIVAQKLSRDSQIETYPVDSIPNDGMVLDLGPATVETIKTNIRAANTLLWNGPLGAFEISPFDAATNVAARAAAVATQKNGLLSVAGGGDTVAALGKAKVLDDFSYISMAGGAFLEWLEGKTLPGIKALSDQN